MNRKKITKEELEVFLRKHKLWLEDDPEGERADLTRADLTGADLYRSGPYRSGPYRSGQYRPPYRVSRGRIFHCL